MLKDLKAEHIFEKCSRCTFLRLSGDNQFICGLCQDQVERGSSLLLDLKQTHNNINIEDPLCIGRFGAVTVTTMMSEITLKANHFSRGLIGFSTGCLHKSGLKLVDKLKAYLRAGATALELGFVTPEQLFNFELTEADMSKLRKFSKITIHAPCRDIKYFDVSGLTNAVIRKLTALSQMLPVSGVVFHPDTVANFNGLEVVPFPVLIENMDRNKKFGTSVEEIREIRDNYDFGFVLDLQHAYEHDPSMTLAHELASAMGNKIRHLHVSGQTVDSYHAPVYKADNKKQICRLLKILPGVPVVLEGIILDEPFASTKREIAYVMEKGDPLN
ncbi:MAG: hypothetical protein Q7K65_04865 [Candidatus Buchananbacteria bacterium]|nr:hypothetical protein [Candidatus Buchananbacteria bacterium]